jgi:hypothetical protein
MMSRKAEMQSYTKSSRSAVVIASLLFALFCGQAHAQEIDGTWKLVMRKLPDGTKQVQQFWGVHGSQRAGEPKRVLAHPGPQACFFLSDFSLQNV